MDRRTVLKSTAGATAAGLLAASATDSASAGCWTDCGDGCSWSRDDTSHLPFSPDADYGGWGGHEYHGTPEGQMYPPVIFVHGNGRDACDWDGHAQYFVDNGYYGDELWAITMNSSTDDVNTNTHGQMRRKLDDFVQKVMNYTGASQVDIVAHSLGVTGAYYWMDSWGRYDWVNTFVGLAGGFNGNCWCSCCCDQGDAGEPCQFIAAQCYYDGHPLYDMQEPDETPSGTNWYTMRGYYDNIYNPCGLHYSPYLSGADENHLEYVTHDGVRTYSKGECWNWIYGNA